MDKILFTEYFGIDVPQKQLDFINIYINADKKFFLDPAKLLLYSDAMSIRMSNSIVNYFEKLLQFVRTEDKKNALKLLKGLKEPKETHLGYALNGYCGNAVGKEKGEKLYYKLSKSNAVKTGLLKDLEESALLVDGVDRDVISDMVVMITKEYLIKFTQQQCEKYQVPMEEVNVGLVWDNQRENWKEMKAKLPVYNGKPMILVPNKIVTDNLTLDSRDFSRNELLHLIQDEILRADSSLVIVLKNGKRRCAITKKQLKNDKRYRYSKEFIYNMIQKYPKTLRDFRRRKKYTHDDIDEKLEQTSA